eukprot:scaffold142255_cov30-Tisochrysis_lutea.AAC.3
MRARRVTGWLPCILVLKLGWAPRAGCGVGPPPATCTAQSLCTSSNREWFRGGAGSTWRCRRPCRACTGCPSRPKEKGKTAWHDGWRWHPVMRYHCMSVSPHETASTMP